MAFNYLQQKTDNNSPQCSNRFESPLSIDRWHFCNVINWLTIVKSSILWSFSLQLKYHIIRYTVSLNRQL